MADELWMCDYCGAPFQTKSACSAHEMKHVRTKMRFTKTSIGQRALRRFIREEMVTNKYPQKQAVAIAYARARKAGYSL